MKQTRHLTLTSLQAPGFYSVFEAVGENFLLSLLILVAIDMVTSPYQGLIHDSRLYALQALSHIYPSRFKQDLFLLFGSQDKFTASSFILSPLIKMLGLQLGMYVGYLSSKILFLSAALSLNRQLIKNQGLALLASFLLASGPLHYIFFDVNEPFLTPRLASCAFCLLGFRALLRHTYWRLGLLMFLAAMLHPVMALGPSIIVTIFLIAHHSRRPSLWFVSIMALAAIPISIAIVSYGAEQLPHNIVMDAKWSEIVIFRSWFLAPLKWTTSEWKTIAASILLACLSIMHLEHRETKRLVLAALLVSMAGIVATVLLTYFFPVTILLQAQPWRIFWILRLLTPALSLLLVSKLWKCSGTCQLAIPLILWPAMLGGGMTDDALYWLLLAGILLSLPPRYSPQFNQKMIQLLILIECILILSPNIMATAGNIITIPQWAHLDDNKLEIVTSALYPILRLLLLSLLIWWLRCRTRMTERFIEAFLVLCLLFWVQPNLTRQTAQALSQTKSNKLTLQAIEVMKKWRPLVPSGSMVLSDGAIEPEMIWFEWQSCCYSSLLQGAGVIFNRDLAIEWAKRADAVQRILSQQEDGLAEWCQKEKIDFIVSRRELPLQKIAKNQGINLYAKLPAPATRRQP